MIVGIDASRAVTTQPTGTEAYAYHLIRNLAPLLQERGHQLRLYFNQPPETPLTSATHEAIYLPAKRLWTHNRLYRELQKNPPDLFFTPAHVIPALYKGKSVATIHDLGFRHFPDAHDKKQRAYLNWSTKHNATKSNLIFADSHATKNDLIDQWNIPSKKIEVVYPGRDQSLRPIRDRELIQQVADKYRFQRPYLLYIGTLQPRKNLVRLMQAYNSIEQQIPHQLIIAGKVGWQADEIVAKANQNPNRIRMIGFVEESDKSALISGASGLLFPSLYEGFGFPVLEGFACGTTVLASRTSSLPEVAGNATELVDPENVEEIAQAIYRICTDSTHRVELTKRGFFRQHQFDWKKSAEQALNLLEKVNNESN